MDFMCGRGMGLQCSIKRYRAKAASADVLDQWDDGDNGLYYRVMENLSESDRLSKLNKAERLATLR
jgi:hypothetical protein